MRFRGLLIMLMAGAAAVVGCGGGEEGSAGDRTTQASSSAKASAPSSPCGEAWNAAANEASQAGLMAFLSGDDGQPVMGTWSKAALEVPVYPTATVETPSGTVSVGRDTCVVTRRGGPTAFPWAYIQADGKWNLTKDEAAARRLLRGLTDARPVSPDSFGKLTLE